MNPRITIDPNVMFGKPVLRGTRITVELVLRKLGAGMTVDEIVAHHPHLAREDVLAALALAADPLAVEEHVPVPASA